MSIVKFTQQTMPQSGEELRRELQKAMDNASPLSDFIQIIRELTQLELEYKLNSEEFFTRFQAGKMGDRIEFIRWATKYEIYQQMKADLDHVFDLLAQYALPVTV